MEILNRSVQVPKSEVAKFHSSQKDQIGNRSFFTEGNNTKPTSFKQVWRKAIEKYAPKQPTMLNEVSYKYEQKLAETRKGNQDYDEDDDDDDSLIDIHGIEGKVKASTVKRVEEIIENYPVETVSVIRSWMSQES